MHHCMVWRALRLHVAGTHPTLLAAMVCTVRSCWHTKHAQMALLHRFQTAWRYIAMLSALQVLGRILIQLATWRGIRTISIVRRQEQIQELRDLGCVEDFEYGSGNSTFCAE